MKTFYLDVEVTVKERWRVQFDAEEKPSLEEMQAILENEEYADIADEELLEVVSVDKIGKDADDEFDDEDE